MTDLISLFQNMKFENDLGTGYNSRVLVVDALNTFMRSYAAIPTLDDDGKHVGGMSGFLKSLGFTIRMFKPTRVLLVFDGQGGSTRRRKLYADYKSQRKPVTRLNRAYDMTTDEEEAENLKYQLVSLIRMLECLPVSILAMDNVEADDVIAYFTELVTQKTDGEVVIYSTDKDFFQMVGDRVKVYNPVQKKTYDVETIVERFGVHPNNFVFYRSLMGDTSDNITGVKGIGEKTSVKLIPELADPNVEVNYEFVQAKYADVKKKPAAIQKVLASKDVIDRNLQLMQLRDVNIDVTAKMKVLHKFEEGCPPLKKSDLTKLLAQTKILSTIPNYDEWITFAFAPLARYYGRT